jgi:hypothetical protein
VGGVWHGGFGGRGLSRVQEFRPALRVSRYEPCEYKIKNTGAVGSDRQRHLVC